MNYKDACLKFPNELVGSYVYCYNNLGGFSTLGTSNVRAWRTVQQGGGAFQVINGPGTTGGNPTIVKVLKSGLISMTYMDGSPSSVDLIIALLIRQPGDSDFRRIVTTQTAPVTSQVNRVAANLTIPLAEGTEIACGAFSTANTGSENQELCFFTCSFLAPVSLKDPIRFGQ